MNWSDSADADPVADERAALDALAVGPLMGPEPVSLREYCRHAWHAQTGEALDLGGPELRDLTRIVSQHGTAVIEPLARLWSADPKRIGAIGRALAGIDPAAIKRRQETRRIVAHRCWQLTRPRRIRIAR